LALTNEYVVMRCGVRCLVWCGWSYHSTV
jgi:hypothetical protein